jgi:ubiquinol-cytochrome c reductase cytochrome b subunit
MSSKAEQAMAGTGTFVDERFGAAGFFRRAMKKVFPDDHWSFMLGEIALYCFIILLLSGTFLTFWFKPSMLEVVYDGSYTKMHGVAMSEAYESTLHLSFDVRGGLLMRQIHHWSALLFVAAMTAHLLRVFFTGAYRKPREINWLIGVVMFTLATVEGLLGYTLPDDLLSGTGMRITQGVMQSIPVVGTYLYFFAFGGELPGHDFIPRIYTLHVLLLPGIFLALIGAHFMILWHQKHTQFPGKGRTENNVVGKPFYPVFMAKSGAYFLFTFAIVAALSTFAQINPVWLFGPYSPSHISAGSQPDFYMGFLEGSLRLMPALETNLLGYTISWNVLIPALGPMGIIMTGLALYPFLEQWVTGDRKPHHLLDRPRNAPVRTGIGMAGVTFYGVLWLAGANDIIADTFHISLFATTWVFRVAVLLGPIVAFIVTKRVCLGMQRADAATLSHGVESGVIKQLPHGEFIEVHQHAREEDVAVLLSKKEIAVPLPPPVNERGVPDPVSRSPLGRIRGALHRAYTADDIPLQGDGRHHDDHGDNGGHGGGHAPGEIEAGSTAPVSTEPTRE